MSATSSYRDEKSISNRDDTLRGADEGKRDGTKFRLQKGLDEKKFKPNVDFKTREKLLENFSKPF